MKLSGYQDTIGYVAVAISECHMEMISNLILLLHS